MSPKYLFAVCVLVIVSLFLHFRRIGSAPPGLYVDESTTAYNAYCIARTGADEYGISFPVFFRCVGEHHDPVTIYALVPLVAMFGLEEWATRFPSALCHVLAAAAFGFLVHKHTRNKWLSLIGAFVFSIVPWVFPLGRTISSGYTPMLLGMTAGWILLLRAFEKPSHGYAVAAGVSWAFAMYSHHVGRPMTALLLLCFALAFWRSVGAYWKVAATFCASLMGALVPMIVSVAHSAEPLTGRFQAISIFQDQPTLAQVLARFGAKYVQYFSPRFLFLVGDENLRHHTGHGGELFLFLTPMIVAGVYGVMRNFRSQAAHRFVALGLLIYPVAAALTMEPMHSTRSVQGAIFWLLAAAIGAQVLWKRRGVCRYVLVGACGLGLIEAALYLNDYFGPYQSRCREAFQSPFPEALKSCFARLGEGRTLYVSKSVGAPFGFVPTADFHPKLYAHILFYGRIDPRMYQRRGLPPELVRMYDGTNVSPGLLLRSNFRLVEPIRKPRVQWEPNPEPVRAGARLLTTIPVKGPMRYEIYEID